MKTDLTYPIAVLMNHRAKLRLENKNLAKGLYWIRESKKDIRQIDDAIRILKSKHQNTKKK